MIINKKSSKIISKVVAGVTVNSKRQGQNSGVCQLTIELKYAVLQIKLISYTAANT